MLRKENRENGYRWQVSLDYCAFDFLSRIQIGVVQDWTDTLFPARVCVFYGKTILAMIVFRNWYRLNKNIITQSILMAQKRSIYTMYATYISLPLLFTLFYKCFVLQRGDVFWLNRRLVFMKYLTSYSIKQCFGWQYYNRFFFPRL